MSQLTAEIGNEIIRSTNALARTMAEANALARLSQPQVWSAEMLRAHYAGLSEAQIVALFTKHCGYQGARGVRMTATLDQVLRVDSILAGRAVAP